eukprot:jgi/Ulvmu1/10902/UM007_0079.1
MAGEECADADIQKDGARRTRPVREDMRVSEVVQSFAETGSQVVWIGGYPRDVDGTEIEADLWAQCPEAVRIEVLAFGSDKIAKKYPEDSKHRGCALVACKGVEAAQQAAALLHQAAFRGRHALFTAPTTKIPPHWDETLYVPGEVLAERKRKAEERAERSQHRARRRQRQSMAHQASVDAALAALPPPGGAAVADAFRPINAATGVEHERLEAWLRSVPWAAMPAQCQPDVQFKDADSERQRQRAARKLAQVESFALVLAQILQVGGLPPAAGGRSGSGGGADDTAAAFHVRGGRVHASPVPSAGSAGDAEAPGARCAEGRRRLRAVDFGCGSGNLTLPLAYAFPGLEVCGVDMKAEAVVRLRERAAAAGLDMVTTQASTIEEFREGCDVVLALHACGNATDAALLQAHRCRAAFIVSPCCVGKLKFSAGIGAVHSTQHGHAVGLPSGGGARGAAAAPDACGPLAAATPCASATADDPAAPTAPAAAAPPAAAAAPAGAPCNGLPLRHPRSDWMLRALPHPAQFTTLARAADISHVESHAAPALAVAAKANIELDRAMAAAEAGYHVQLVKLRSPELTTKSDIIVGVPRERLPATFRWPWPA